MILYIHGFASCGLGRKSIALRKWFGAGEVLTPDLAHEPEVALAQLREMRAAHPVDLLIGSSLGGFYATALNASGPPLPAVLINPAIRPHRLLRRALGPQRRWCDGAPFELTRAHLAQLGAMHRIAPDADRETYLVLLQSGDEVLDYRDAAAYYAGFDVRVRAGGDHRFQHLEEAMQTIDDWRARQRKHAQDSQATL